jgi:hypothetical protein
MLKHASLASLFALSLSACGSAVVVPTVPGDAASTTDSPSAADVATATDAARPPQGDAGFTDVTPPPVDAGQPTIAALCRDACARQARQCGGDSQSCETSCARIERTPGSERCQTEIRSSLRCLVDMGFVCRGGSGEVPPACQALFTAVQRCVGSVMPPPDVDAGPPPMTLPVVCETYCALSDRACAPSDRTCRTQCAETVTRLSPVCQTRFSAIVDCIGTNRVVCERGLAQPPEICRPLLDAFRPCGMGSTTDDGGVPVPDDAGTEPVPVDAGGPDV